LVRNLTDAAENEKNKSYNRPIELYQIFLDGETLYLANYKKNIEFYDEEGNEQTYEAAALSRGDISTSQELSANQVEVQIDNVARDMSAYLESYNFRGRKMRILKVFLDDDLEVGDFEDRIEMFEGVMDETAIDQKTLTVEVITQIDIADHQIPRRKYYLDCGFEFGDPDTCGVEISKENDTKVTGQVDSVKEDNKTKLYISEITDDDDNYWAYGYIEVLGETRFIQRNGTEDGTGYIILDMPFFIDVTGEDFEIIAGCDKTFDLEDKDNGDEYNHGCAFWNNKEYFGGFLSIPEARDVSS